MNKNYIFVLVALSAIMHASPVKTESELKEQLYELEGKLFYKKHLAYSKTIREKTAFIVGLAGIAGSFAAPFKLVKSNPRHPVNTFAKRVSVCAVCLCAATTAVCSIEYLRPIIYWHEYKRDRLKAKIFELQNAQKKI